MNVSKKNFMFVIAIVYVDRYIYMYCKKNGRIYTVNIKYIVKKKE